MSLYYIALDSLTKSSLLGAMPSGISFNPSETQLVSDYLCRKTSQTMLSPLEEGLVQTCDLYGEEEPWQIWERLGGGRNQEEDLHLFTKLKLKNRKGTRRITRSRSVGTSGGYWHEDYSKPSQDLEFNGKIETFQKKRYTYKNPGSTQDCCWIMFEYKCSLSEEIVLVVLNKNKSKKRPAAAALDIKSKNKKIRAEADGTKQIPMVQDTTHQSVHIEAVQEAERSWESQVDDCIIDNNFQEAERSWESQVTYDIVDNNFQEAERSWESQVDDDNNLGDAFWNHILNHFEI